ncbi:MAG: hypothetical protein V4567_01115 [Pseudomonadota bacterium]
MTVLRHGKELHPKSAQAPVSRAAGFLPEKCQRRGSDFKRSAAHPAGHAVQAIGDSTVVSNRQRRCIVVSPQPENTP